MTPRLPPTTREQWDDATRVAITAGFGAAAADRFLGDGPDASPMPNVLGTLLHHPRLAASWLAYNRELLFEPVLDPRLRELAILRVAWRTRSAYEWAQHVRFGLTVGVTAAQVDALTTSAGAGVLTALEADVVAAADQLLDGYRIADDTWDRLAEHLDERQRLELIFVVGSYACLAMVFNTAGIEFDADMHDIPAPPIPEED
ncbi:MAG: carboxymuconolactone decarboxylase [Acidimicrobiia bacterium]